MPCIILKAANSVKPTPSGAFGSFWGKEEKQRAQATCLTDSVRWKTHFELDFVAILEPIKS